MQLTPYHAQYYAYALTQTKSGDNLSRVGHSLINAKIDLNPHQIDAALFAFKSPLRKGALLADEVGLGKTIEAGIVLTQFWVEQKGKILIITPSNLRKQWSEELLDKFFLHSKIIDRKAFDRSIKDGKQNPFDQAQPIICSYHFAKNYERFIRSVQWNLVVMDEAHKVRNVYKTSNVIGKTLKRALAGRKKLLLTATPLQNSLLELYGLISFIDDYIFGDQKSFKQQFINQRNDDQYNDLKDRLKMVAHRNLRNNVQEYVQYTARKALTFEFIPYEKEKKLYDLVSGYLQRETLYALPNSQRQLVTLVLRKLLASSTYAISGTLESLINRLQALIEDQEKNVKNDLNNDYEALDEIEEEWSEEEHSFENKGEITEIKAEINELQEYLTLAREIQANSKGERLKSALPEAFEEIKRLGGQEKAVIFTESKRTQFYLKELLEKEPEYQRKIVLFNGQNDSKESKQIYNQWIQTHKGSDKITGSKEADTRAALVDYFREHAKFDPQEQGFWLNTKPIRKDNIPKGFYTFRKNTEKGHVYRLGHPLAEYVVNQMKSKNLNSANVVFDYSHTREKHKPLESLIGKKGEMAVYIHRIQSLEKEENFICLGYTEQNEELNQEQIQRMFDLSGKVIDEEISLKQNFESKAKEQAEYLAKEYQQHRAQIFNEEYDKLSRWAKDKQNSVKEKLKSLEKELEELRRKRRTEQDEIEKLNIAKQIRKKEQQLDKEENNFRKESREIDRQKEAMMDEIEHKMKFQETLMPLFSIKWKLI